MQEKGSISIHTENIFPIIKKFLSSDNEIFLRELVSNAVDAVQKIKRLSSLGQYQGEIGAPLVEVAFDKDAKTITISDNGLGMTAEEIKKYINQIAFSGAEEFVEKFKDAKDANELIGKFGLGFYSAFMVADQVEIQTLSYQPGAEAARWICDGSTEFEITEGSRTTRGTDIILHVNADSEEFLDKYKLQGILDKYCKFLPVPIKFGTKTEYDYDAPETEGEEENKKPTEKEVDNIINDTNPIWTKSPADLKDEDYLKFYRELYPMSEEPLFWIHLNVDYPFTLTGVLYFPKVKNDFELQRNKIKLFSRQVFITDEVKDIVPDFLMLLHGVIDSPDIPLNVSRSYLQADGNVKKISNYITRKVSDKLKSLFTESREDFENKWNDIKIVLEYGMLSEPKFYEKAGAFTLYPTVSGKYFTLDELKENLKEKQTDKDGKLVLLYAGNKDAQHSYIAAAEEKGYEVLLLDSPIVSHLIQKLEGDNSDVTFVRVDSDHIDNLIKKEDTAISKLSDEEKETLKNIVQGVAPQPTYNVQLEALDSQASPFLITQPEFMRRMKEMSQTGGGMFGMGNMPEMYNLIVNTNSELATSILENKDDAVRAGLVKQALDLARLSQNLLKGEELTAFVKRSFEMIK